MPGRAVRSTTSCLRHRTMKQHVMSFCANGSARISEGHLEKKATYDADHHLANPTIPMLQIANTRSLHTTSRATSTHVSQRGDPHCSQPCEQRRPLKVKSGFQPCQEYQDSSIPDPPNIASLPESDLPCYRYIPFITPRNQESGL